MVGQASSLSKARARSPCHQKPQLLIFLSVPSSSLGPQPRKALLCLLSLLGHPPSHTPSRSASWAAEKPAPDRAAHEGERVESEEWARRASTRRRGRSRASLQCVPRL